MFIVLTNYNFKKNYLGLEPPTLNIYTICATVFNSKKLFLNIKKLILWLLVYVYNSVIPIDETNIHFCNDVAECNEDLCKKMSRVQSTKYWGITFVSNLRWNLHKNNILKRLRSAINKFYKLKNILPINILRNIY